MQKLFLFLALSFVSFQLLGQSRFSKDKTIELEISSMEINISENGAFSVLRPYQDYKEGYYMIANSGNSAIDENYFLWATVHVDPEQPTLIKKAEVCYDVFDYYTVSNLNGGPSFKVPALDMNEQSSSPISRPDTYPFHTRLSNSQPPLWQQKTVIGEFPMGKPSTENYQCREVDTSSMQTKLEGRGYYQLRLAIGAKKVIRITKATLTY
jgi:hypothetical protein